MYAYALVCDHTMILLVIRYKMVLHPFMNNTEIFLLGLFQGHGACQYDPRANSTKTSEKQNTPTISRCSSYQHHNKHSGLSHTGIPFFLRKAMFTPQHFITTDKGYRNLTEAVQSSSPFCLSTVFNTISYQSKFFLFSVTLKQWVTISWYPMPQFSREGEAAYTFLFIIFIMNIGPGT